MKTSSFVALAACLVPFVGADPVVPRQSDPSTAPAYPICQGDASFATFEGRVFNYNGTGPKYFAGTNAWWLSHIMTDSDVDAVYTEIKEVGWIQALLVGFEED